MNAHLEQLGTIVRPVSFRFHFNFTDKFVYLQSQSVRFAPKFIILRHNVNKKRLMQNAQREQGLRTCPNCKTQKLLSLNVCFNLKEHRLVTSAVAHSL